MVNELAPPERHSAGGPLSDYQRDCKKMASLLWICLQDDRTAEWAMTVGDTPEVSTMLASDLADGGHRQIVGG